MINANIKKGLARLGIDTRKLAQGVCRFSVKLASRENGFEDLVKRLRKIVPDISRQESSGEDVFNEYWELKRRTLQAFQCSMMVKALEFLPSGKLNVVDIGDSAGTHMLYLKELCKKKDIDIDSVSVNLDSRAIEKIKSRGLKAMLCRAEELDLGGKPVDLFTSFQMVEHLHDPAIFFRRLAKKTSGNLMVITVPYLKKSRVGLHSLRDKRDKLIYAENEHIFELSPKDWSLLFLHSGWRVIHDEIYHQYPRKIPLVRHIFARYWRLVDFEGFWGAILKRDTSLSDLYQDWPV
ncbi:MAG: methyltransferase domain-containing protein [Candidatus Omnitrophota bacterium]|nr:MAG: methyltransferase domain-containing protein [Candidatus Omnitrophota bacterium]